MVFEVLIGFLFEQIFSWLTSCFTRCWGVKVKISELIYYFFAGEKHLFSCLVNFLQANTW